MDQPMRVDAIGSPFYVLEIKKDSITFTGLFGRAQDALDSIGAAKFSFKIDLSIQSAGRHFRIEQEWPPANLGTHLRAERQGALEAVLADIAPRTNGIENYINAHDRFQSTFTRALATRDMALSSG